MLGDTTCLACNDIGIANMVKQRCLTVVDMTHDGDNRGAAHQVVLVILLFGDGILHLCRDVFCGKAELLSHNVDGLSIQALVDRHHDTDAHTGSDNLIDTYIHHRCQLRDSYEFCQLQHL